MLRSDQSSSVQGQRQVRRPRVTRLQLAKPSPRATTRIVWLYAALSALWFIGSDLAVYTLTNAPAPSFLVAELVKGLLFVACTAALLYIVIRRVVGRLTRNDERLRLLAEHVPDVIYRLRTYPDHAFEYVSPAATMLTGYTPDEFYADPKLVYKLVHPEDYFRQAVLGRGGLTLGSTTELRWVRKDGSFVWTEQRNVPIYNDEGHLVAIEGMARDISQRKAAEAQIVCQRRDLEQIHAALVQSYDTTLSGWSGALDLRDRETEGHSARVTTMAVRLAQTMGLTGEELEHIRRGALLHDIGKIGIPDAILHKPGPLSEAEWAVMRRHPQYAYDLLAPIAFLRSALVIPYGHHERWDGSGYPQGLRGEAIPLAARIFAVVDVWDALSSTRPYRPAWPPEQVETYLSIQAGLLFDPAVVRAFLTLIAQDRQAANTCTQGRRVA